MKRNINTTTTTTPFTPFWNQNTDTNYTPQNISPSSPENSSVTNSSDQSSNIDDIPLSEEIEWIVLHILNENVLKKGTKTSTAGLIRQYLESNDCGMVENGITRVLERLHIINKCLDERIVETVSKRKSKSKDKKKKKKCTRTYYSLNEKGKGELKKCAYNLENLISNYSDRNPTKKDLDDIDYEILEILTKYPNINIPKIAAHSNFVESTIRRHVEKLEKDYQYCRNSQKKYAITTIGINALQRKKPENSNDNSDSSSASSNNNDDNEKTRQKRKMAVGNATTKKNKNNTEANSNNNSNRYFASSDNKKEETQRKADDSTNEINEHDDVDIDVDIVGDYEFLSSFSVN